MRINKFLKKLNLTQSTFCQKYFGPLETVCYHSRSTVKRKAIILPHKNSTEKSHKIYTIKFNWNPNKQNKKLTESEIFRA